LSYLTGATYQSYLQNRKGFNQEWYGLAKFLGDPVNSTITIGNYSGVNWNLYVKWNCDPGTGCIVNQTNYDCKNESVFSEKSCTGSIVWTHRGIASVIYDNGTLSNSYDISMKP
jgi:hypothetical protein